MFPLKHLTILRHSSFQFIKSANVLTSSKWLANNYNFLTTQANVNLYDYFQNIHLDQFNNEVKQQRPNGLRFIPYENIFAHCVLKKVFDSNETRKVSLPFEIKTLLNTLMNDDHSIMISNDQYSINKLSSLNQKEVITVLQTMLRLIPFYKDEVEWNRELFKPTLSEAWKSIDKVCYNLLKKVKSKDSLQNMIIISRLWFELGLIRKVNFNQNLTNLLVNLSRPWTKLELLHLMFCLNLQRSISPQHLHLIMNKVETCLNDSSISLNLDELSIIAMGFFKTKTKMPLPMLFKFVSRLKTELVAIGSKGLIRSMSIVSCFKMIRLSLNTTSFNPRNIRNEMKMITDIVSSNVDLLHSNIFLTHFILFLNSAYLHNENKLFKLIFDRMIDQLNIFRIKDIERILFCLMNVNFICNSSKMKLLEEHLLNCDESRIYSYHIYNIVLFMLAINYHPQKLIDLCLEANFLKKSIDSSTFELSLTILTLDTFLRLNSNKSLLTSKQVKQYQMEHLANSNKLSHSIKARLLRVINDSLKQKFGHQFGLFYLFPFYNYPFPVILSKKMAKQIDTMNYQWQNKKSSKDNTIINCCHPFHLESIKAGYFDDCKAILLLTNRDLTYSRSLRGMIQLNKQLLQKLGFKVIELHYSDLSGMNLPEHALIEGDFSQNEMIDRIDQAVQR